MFLDDELKQYGCEINGEEFNQMLTDLHGTMNKGLNEEQLLYDCFKGVRFVETVRDLCNCPRLSAEMILRRLNNIRKKPINRRTA